MSHSSKVTVVIPTYNRARWLPEAIESVLTQTMEDLSLIVSDNASTDSTPEVVASIRDPRVTYVRQSTHLGLNEHFSRCLTTATASPYIFLLPDDDLMLPALLEREVEVLEVSPEVGFVHSPARIIAADGRVIQPVHNMTRTLQRDTIEPGHVYIRETMKGGYRVHGSTVLFRAAAVAGERYDDADYPATDFGLMLRMAIQWDIAFVASPLAAYRVHSKTYTAEAGADAYTGGYIQGRQMIQKIREVKLRFLSDCGSLFPDRTQLERTARKSMRRDLIVRANLVTPDRAFLSTAREVARDLRIDPLLVIEPATWRLLAANFAGARARQFVRNLRHVSGSTR